MHRDWWHFDFETFPVKSWISWLNQRYSWVGRFSCRRKKITVPRCLGVGLLSFKASSLPWRRRTQWCFWTTVQKLSVFCIIRKFFGKCCLCRVWWQQPITSSNRQYNYPLVIQIQQMQKIQAASSAENLQLWYQVLEMAVELRRTGSE